MFSARNFGSQVYLSILDYLAISHPIKFLVGLLALQVSLPKTYASEIEPEQHGRELASISKDWSIIANANPDSIDAMYFPYYSLGRNVVAWTQGLNYTVMKFKEGDTKKLTFSLYDQFDSSAFDISNIKLGVKLSRAESTQSYDFDLFVYCTSGASCIFRENFWSGTPRGRATIRTPRRAASVAEFAAASLPTSDTVCFFRGNVDREYESIYTDNSDRNFDGLNSYGLNLYHDNFPAYLEAHGIFDTGHLNLNYYALVKPAEDHSLNIIKYQLNRIRKTFGYPYELFPMTMEEGYIYPRYTVATNAVKMQVDLTDEWGKASLNLAWDCAQQTANPNDIGLCYQKLNFIFVENENPYIYFDNRPIPVDTQPLIYLPSRGKHTLLNFAVLPNEIIATRRKEDGMVYAIRFDTTGKFIAKLNLGILNNSLTSRLPNGNPIVLPSYKTNEINVYWADGKTIQQRAYSLSRAPISLEVANQTTVKQESILDLNINDPNLDILDINDNTPVNQNLNIEVNGAESLVKVENHSLIINPNGATLGTHSLNVSVTNNLGESTQKQVDIIVEKPTPSSTPTAASVTPSPETVNSSSYSEITRNAVIGIASGVAAGVAAIFFTGLGVWCSRRRKAQDGDPTNSQSAQMQSP